MLQTRNFRRRNKPVTVQVLTDLVAVPAATAPRTTSDGHGTPLAALIFSPARPRKQVRLPSKRLDAIAPRIPLPQVRALEDAGWTFLSPEEANALHQKAARVIVKPDGRLALSNGRLTVQFTSLDIQDEAAARLLEKFDCRVLQRLTFAPGLYLAAVDDASQLDAMQAAEQLMQSGQFTFAEPDFIEVVAGR